MLDDRLRLGVAAGQLGRLTKCIVDGVVGMLAPEQQIWSGEIRCPGCVDGIEVIVGRERAGIRV